MGKDMVVEPELGESIFDNGRPQNLLANSEGAHTDMFWRTIMNTVQIISGKLGVLKFLSCVPTVMT